MMKFKYFFTLILTTIMFAGCSEDNEPAGQLGNISVSDTYAVIPNDGGSVKVTVSATENWAITNVEKNEDGKLQLVDAKGKKSDLWFGISQLSGTAGETELTFTADAVDGGRETELQITVGENTKQFLMVRQGSLKAVKATCADVLNGVDGKSYCISGVVTSIVSQDYGNMYVSDGTGVVYIYGTLDKDGKEKNFSSLGIEVGDFVELEGPRTTYKDDIELVNVTVNKITKSLMKVISPNGSLGKEGGDFEVRVAYKGNGAFVDIPVTYRDWIIYNETEYIAGVPTKIEQNPADTAVFRFKALPNVGGARNGEIIFKSLKGKEESSVVYNVVQEGSIVEASIADFLAAANKNTQYRVTGAITKVTDMSKGRYTIRDHSGEVYVFNCDLGGNDPKIGDIVTLTGKYDKYKETEELVSGIVEKNIAVKEVSIADFRAAEDNKEAYYMLTGKVVKSSENDTKWDLDVYGNFAIQDENGNEVYVYGLTTGWGGPSKMCGTLGLQEGDVITIIGYHTSYKGLVEVGGAFFFEFAE